MLGLADTAPPSERFVIEPERSSGEHAFAVGGEDYEDHQMRELDDGLDQVEIEFADGLELLDPVDPPPASQAPPSKAPTSKGADPTQRLRKLKMLHDEGLITDEEFHSKRSQILKEM
jgi:hypothetical protein